MHPVWPCKADEYGLDILDTAEANSTFVHTRSGICPVVPPQCSGDVPPGL